VKIQEEYLRAENYAKKCEEDVKKLNQEALKTRGDIRKCEDDLDNSDKSTGAELKKTRDELRAKQVALEGALTSAGEASAGASSQLAVLKSKIQDIRRRCETTSEDRRRLEEGVTGALTKVRIREIINFNFSLKSLNFLKPHFCS
jgi:hypothetical protein